MKTVLITGANRGIGLGLVKAYTHVGWRVIACCRDPKSLDGFRGSRDGVGEHVLVRQMDVVQRSSIQRVVENLRSQQIGLDLVVANAGVFNHQEMADWTEANFMDTYSVNTVGTAMLAREVESIVTPGGLFCAISSAMGSLALEVGFEGDGDAYAMSKAALNMLCVRLAKKWESKKIRAIAISPGWVRTDMGGSDATISVEESVQKLVKTFAAVTGEQSGLFLNNDGAVLPW